MVHFFLTNGASVETEAKSLKAAISKIKDEELSKLLELSQTKLSEITGKANREKNNESV